MQRTGAEASVVGRKAQKWCWTEGALSFVSYQAGNSQEEDSRG